jgi:hypothetical protein
MVHQRRTNVPFKGTKPGAHASMRHNDARLPWNSSKMPWNRGKFPPPPDIVDVEDRPIEKPSTFRRVLRWLGATA